MNPSQSRKQSHALAITALALLAGASLNAHAGSTNASFNSSASVNASCQSLSATNLEFGTYDPTSGSDKTATSTISVACTTGTAPTISFSAGTTSGASTTQRLLTNGTHTLNYNIYTSNAYSQVLDSTHTLSVTGTGLGSSVSATAYGSITKNQMNVSTGNYTDTITVTVTY